MLSETSNARLGEIHPELSRRIRQLDAMLPSLSIQVAQGLRSWVDQDNLYAQGRTAPGKIVTNAPGGHSMHNFGLAVDLFPEDAAGRPDWDINHDSWKKLLAAAPSCGLSEGAQWRTFPDNPHFYPQELPPNPTDEMRQTFRDGGMQAVWDLVMIEEHSAT